MAVSEARLFIDTYFMRYPGIRRFMDGIIEQARREGLVRTMLGRVRPIEGLSSRNKQSVAAAERLAVNTVIQGSAADLIKRAMIRLHQRIHDERRPSRMIIQVHDELVFETAGL
jgi:DNA polymerase-1